MLLEMYPPAEAAQTNVVVSTFKQKRLGGRGPESARLIPIFLSAHLSDAGASVVALQASELAYLERLIKLAGLTYGAASRDLSVAPASLMLEGDYELNSDHTYVLHWRTVDLSKPEIVAVAHDAAFPAVSFQNLYRLARAIMVGGEIQSVTPARMPAKPVVVVGGFQSDVAVSPEIGWMMEDIVLASLQRMPGIKTVERREIRKIENELKLSLSGAVDPSRGVVLGRLTQADLVIYGAAARDTAGYSYAVLVADVWSGLVFRAVTGTCRTKLELAPAVESSVRQILKNVPGESARAAQSSPAGMEAAYTLYRAVHKFERSQLFPDEVELAAALEEVERVLLLKPEDPAARYLRGKILLKLKRIEEATDEFMTVVRMDPAGIWAGESHKELGDRHFYHYADGLPQPNTGQSMTWHYMASAIDFPASFGAWESIIRLAQIYSGKEMPETVFVPIYEKLIRAHPDHRNIVLYQWASRYLYEDYAGNWDRVQPIFAQMDPKGWWHQFRVLRIADIDEAILTDRVQTLYDARAVWAFDQAEELEGKLLLTTCMKDDQPLHGKRVIEVRRELAAQMLNNSRTLIDITLAEPTLSDEEKAAVLYNATRKMILITFSYSRRFEHLEAIAAIGLAILRHFPDAAPYPMYVIHDMLESCHLAPGDPTVTDILNVVGEYVVARPRLPGRTDMLERLLKLNIKAKRWTSAERLLTEYEGMKDVDEKELRAFRRMVDGRARYRGSWRPSTLVQGRDFLVRFARPAFNFMIK